MWCSEKSIMLQRRKFVMLFEQNAGNRRELCRRFGLGLRIGNRLLARCRREGAAGLADRSHRRQSGGSRRLDAGGLPRASRLGRAQEPLARLMTLANGVGPSRVAASRACR